MDWDSTKGVMTALGIGLLIGAIRERHSAEPMAGLRTHALVAIVGVVSMQLGMGAYIAAVLAVGALAVAGYMRNDPDDLGLTGEVALLVNVSLAGLAYTDQVLATALGVTAAALLQAKRQLKNLSRNIITEQEIKDGLLLLAAALVVMPLLPTEALDPWGVLRPRTIWKIVVLVMGTGMLGHVALRMVGARWGLAVAGFFAGFASSTAATASFGARVKADSKVLMAASSAAILANLASLLLLLAVVWSASPELLLSLAWPMGAAVLVLVVNAAFGLRSASGQAEVEDEGGHNAFKLSHAVLIAAIIGGVSLVAAWVRHTFGDTAAIAAAMLAALTELQAAAVSIAQMNTSGSMPTSYAQWGLIGILTTSGLAKSVLGFVSGGPRYGLRVSTALVGMVLAAATVQWMLPAGA